MFAAIDTATVVKTVAKAVAEEVAETVVVVKAVTETIAIVFTEAKPVSEAKYVAEKLQKQLKTVEDRRRCRNRSKNSCKKLQMMLQ